MEIIKQDNELTIAVSPIKSLEHYKDLLAVPEIFCRIETFRSTQRKCEWLTTIRLIQQLTGVLQTYDYQQEKPICKLSKHFLGISHSDKHTAIGISLKHTIGIDIEEKNRDFTKTAQKFLHKNERKWALTNDDFHLIWCAKESLYKLIPFASPNFSEHYEVFFHNELHNQPYISVNYRQQHVYTVNIFKNPEFLLTWAVDY